MKICVLSLLLIWSCFSVSFSQNSGRSEEKRSEPKLYFKKNDKEVTDKRSPKTILKILNPNNKSQSIDFTVENIGETKGLEVVSESLDEKYKNWKVVVKNKGIVKSDNSAYVVAITKYVSAEPSYSQPSPKPVSSVIFQETRILPKLNPNEEMTFWISFEKSGMPIGEKNIFSEMFSKTLGSLGSLNTWYKIDTYFVTEPIVIK
jgi:hypothetical protein